MTVPSQPLAGVVLVARSLTWLSILTLRVSVDMRGRIRQIGKAHRQWWVVLIVVAIFVALGIALSLYQLSQTQPLMFQADALPAGETRLVRQREILQFQVDNLAKIWTTIVQVIVGVVLATGAVATWRNLGVVNEVQITNRFTQAIGQLGTVNDGQPNLEVRLGGIYALERIARDSPRDHWTIMEILTAYVRQNARWTMPDPPLTMPALFPDRAKASPELVQQVKEKSEELKASMEHQIRELEEGPQPLRIDIQASLTVIGRRVRSNDPQDASLDLHRTDLRRAELANANLERANLNQAHLDDANLSGAHMENADLSGAHVVDANLLFSHLENAQGLTDEQVYSSLLQGRGAIVPDDWPSDWLERLESAKKQLPLTPPAPPAP